MGFMTDLPFFSASVCSYIRSAGARRARIARVRDPTGLGLRALAAHSALAPRPRARRSGPHAPARRRRAAAARRGRRGAARGAGRHRGHGGPPSETGAAARARAEVLRRQRQRRHLGLLAALTVVLRARPQRVSRCWPHPCLDCSCLHAPRAPPPAPPRPAGAHQVVVVQAQHGGDVADKRVAVRVAPRGRLGAAAEQVRHAAHERALAAAAVGGQADEHGALRARRLRVAGDRARRCAGLQASAADAAARAHVAGKRLHLDDRTFFGEGREEGRGRRPRVSQEPPNADSGDVATLPRCSNATKTRRA